MSLAHRLTAIIFARDGHQCVYCGVTEVDTDNFSVDHVVPRVMFERGIAEGDSEDPSNLVTACAGCNSLKRDMTVDVFALYLVRGHGGTRDDARARMRRVKAAASRKVPK